MALPVPLRPMPVPKNRNTLNARQEAFCRGLTEGKSQSTAYVEAGYDARGNAVEVSRKSGQER